MFMSKNPLILKIKVNEKFDIDDCKTNEWVWFYSPEFTLE